MSNSRQVTPLFKAGQGVPNLEDMIVATGSKHIKQKSVYYNWQSALELLPEILELIKDPTQARVYPIAAFGIKACTLRQKINAAWQFICDFGDTNDYLWRFIRDVATITKIREARGQCEIIMLDTAVAIRQRARKYAVAKELVQRRKVLKVDWREIFRAWMSKDNQTEPLDLRAIDFKPGEAEKLRNLLAGLVDQFDYEVGENHMWIKIKTAQAEEAKQ